MAGAGGLEIRFALFTVRGMCRLKITKIVAAVALSIVAVFTMLELVLGWVGDEFFQLDYDEVSRITSPDRKVDAVLVRIGGNATVGFFFHVYVVPTGKAFSKGNASLEADEARGLKIRWDKPRVLDIEYDEANIYAFQNQWRSKAVDNSRYAVRLRLKDNGK